MKRLFLLITILCAVMSIHAQEDRPEVRIEAVRLERLSKGINLTNWYWFGPQTVNEIRAVYTTDDFTYLRETGFRHVRIPVDLSLIYDERYENQLSERIMPVLEESIQKLIDADLGVIINIHSTDLPSGPGSLENDPVFVEKFATFWGNFAGRLSKFDPAYVFFEPVNEPAFAEDPSAWWTVQEQIVTAIRETAPEHTIIATAAYWSGIFTLVKMEPLADRNVVYNFHFYEPYIFTHQGVERSGSLVSSAREVPYPSNPRKIEPALAHAEGNDELITALQTYGDALWDQDRIEEEIAWVDSWARRHGVHLICTEFGVYKQFAPVVDREQWFADTRLSFEEYGIGWTMWEYTGGFGLVEREEGEITHDQGVVEALGLNIVNEE